MTALSALSALPATVIENDVALTDETTQSANIMTGLTVGQAASILGQSQRSVRRMCSERELSAERDDRGRWLIDPASRAEFRIAAGQIDTPVMAGTELASMDHASRERMYEKVFVVRAFLAAENNRPANMGKTVFLKSWLAAFRMSNIGHGQSNTPSASQMYEWLKRYRAEGMAGLKDNYSNGVAKRRSRASDTWSADAKEYFTGMYLNQNQPAIPRLYQIMAAKGASENWNIPSLRTVQNYASKKLDPKVRMAGRQPKKFRDRCLPTAIRDWTKVPACAAWVADHRNVDFSVPYIKDSSDNGNASSDAKKYGWGRPWVTLWLDCRTWKPMAARMRFENPNGVVVMETFVAGVKEYGLPEHAYMDNGKDFRMKRFAGGRPKKNAYKNKGDFCETPEKIIKPMLTALGVESTFALPYNARAKVVEPWFKIMAENFDKTWPTYHGSRPELKPENLAIAKKCAAEYYANGLTIENVSRAFNAWINEDYCLRKSPAKAAREFASVNEAFDTLRTERIQPTEADLHMLLMPSMAVCVQANGIYVRQFGQFYWNDALENRSCGGVRDIRRKIRYRFDPADASQIFVFDASSDRYLCAAEPYIGQGLHPLARSTGDKNEMDRVSATMALNRGMAKRINRQVRDAKQFAGNSLLAAAQDAGQKLGLHTQNVKPKSNRNKPKSIKLTERSSESAAMVADAERIEIRRNAEKRRQSAADFFVNNANKATGTDDAISDNNMDERVDGPSALDALIDGASEKNAMDGDSFDSFNFLKTKKENHHDEISNGNTTGKDPA